MANETKKGAEEHEKHKKQKQQNGRVVEKVGLFFAKHSGRNQAEYGDH